MDFSELQNHVSIGISPTRTKIMNYAFSRVHGENQLSFFNKKIDYFEFEIHHKLNLLKELKRTIERSRTHNSQEGNVGQTAFNYSITRIEELVVEYNSRVIENEHCSGSPLDLEEKRGTILRGNPVMKISQLFNELFNSRSR